MTDLAEAAVTDAALAGRFAPVFAAIAAGAVQREKDRELPFDAVRMLVEAGFTAVRVPLGDGGGGASLPQLVELVSQLAEADPNVAQLLRGHFLFGERLVITNHRSTPAWFDRFVNGELVGNAQSERSAGTEILTTISNAASAEHPNWLVNGTKYYSTGTIFSDWVWITAVRDGIDVGAVVSTRLPGVTVRDDWDGFGQKMTGSGTVVFDNVPLEPGAIDVLGEDAAHQHADTRVFQHLFLLATMAGIGRAARADAVQFVQSRTRAYGVAGQSSPREDPQVQIVLGNLAALVYSAEAVVGDVARQLEDVRLLASAPGADLNLLAAEYGRVQIAQFTAQQVVVKNVIEATNQLFEVGGASAISQDRALDRHWRNARTIGSHNPAIFRQRAIGDYLLNGTLPANPGVSSPG